MKLKPRRFWLPAIATSFSGLLMWLENTFHANNVLNILNEVFNFPAYIAFNQLTIPGYHLYGFNTWIERCLFLTLVGLCWYFVGVELDFRVLQRMAARWRILRFCWIVVALTLQGSVIWAIVSFCLYAFRYRATEPFDRGISIFFGSFVLSWYQLFALRFWKARKAAPVRSLNYLD